MITATLDIVPKIHDESRQGEAFSFSTVVENPNGKNFYIESHGCQMNFSDSEIVASILQKEGFKVTTDYLLADLVLINTCSIRENAEQKVRDRLQQFKNIKANQEYTSIEYGLKHRLYNNKGLIAIGTQRYFYPVYVLYGLN